MLLNAQQIGVVDGADDVCTFPVDSIDSQVYGMGWDAGYCLHTNMEYPHNEKILYVTSLVPENGIDAGREEPEQ